MTPYVHNAEHCSHCVCACVCACARKTCRSAAVHAALALLSSPPPPVTQPNVTAPVEVKALATAEEAAFEGLRNFAAWWVPCTLGR